MFIATQIVASLPTKLQPYAKSLIPACAAVITVGITYAMTGTFDADGMKAAMGLAGAAIMTFILPNKK